MTRPLTLRAVSERLGVTQSTALRLVHTGQLAATIIRGRGNRGTYRVSEIALAEYEKRIPYRPFAAPPQVTRIESPSRLLIDMARPRRDS